MVNVFTKTDTSLEVSVATNLDVKSLTPEDRGLLKIK